MEKFKKQTYKRPDVDFRDLTDKINQTIAVHFPNQKFLQEVWIEISKIIVENKIIDSFTIKAEATRIFLQNLSIF